MIRKFTVTLEYSDEFQPKEIEDEIVKRFKATDGRQHLDLINWEPVPISIISAKAVELNPCHYDDERDY